jgi:hypothetical protein
MTRIIKWASLFLWLAACSNQTGTDTGNPTAVSVRFAGLQAPGVTLTEARIVLKAIDLDPVSVCQAEAELGDFETPDESSDLPGPFVVDLLAGITIPDTETFSIPAGFYCEMDVEFDRLEPEDVPEGIAGDDPIVGLALLVRGARGDGTPFLLRLSRDDRFKLEASSPTGFLIKNNVLTPFFVRFDLNAWFSGVDLDAAAVTDGTILLDDAANADLKALILENIKRAAQLFLDLDGDGALEADESADTLALAVGSDEPD